MMARLVGKNGVIAIIMGSGLNRTTLAIFIAIVVYYGFWASDRYVSEAVFTIQESNPTTSGYDLGFLNFSADPGIQDELIMREYLVSRDMMEHLDEVLDIKRHYQSSGIDWFSSLASDATREEFLEYYRDHIKIHFDDASGLLSVEVQAFEREAAKMILQTIMQKSDQFVNDIAQKLALSQYQFFETQLTTTKESLKQANHRLVLFQNKYRMFSPEQEGQSLTAIMDALQGELANERALLKELLGSQQATAPFVIASKERIRALTEQIEDEKRRLSGEGEDELNDLVAQFTNLKLDLELAKETYASALAALEQSRAEVSKKMKHLVIVSQPSSAEEAKYPDREYIILTALIILLMLNGIIRMIITTIKEHRD